jgi:hypothetical protein
MGVGKSVVALDVFDKPSTCRTVWDRLLTGAILDALETGTPSASDHAGAADVEALLARLSRATWDETAAVGQGRELRAEADSQTHASALLVDDTVIHGSVIVAS